MERGERTLTSKGREQPGFYFAVPPSLGQEPVKELARRFADVLYQAGFSTVVPYKTYEDLEQALLAGEVDAAWGPPLICERLEAVGGQVALRAVRYGALTYRSVLLCRASDDLDLRTLGKPGGRTVRAAWVDSWSMAGYALPRRYLESLGVDLEAALSQEATLGSYLACFQAVLDDQADITASFANRRGLGYVKLVGDRAFELRTLAYTEECPNDAVILGPRLKPEDRSKIIAGLHNLMSHAASLEILAQTFNVDGFSRP